MTQPDALTVQPGPRKRVLLLALLSLLGCGHTEPFSSAPTGSDQPFDPTPPVRLTLNQGPDRGATWLPDGSGILYSAQQLGRKDHDVCLALIPPSGGSQRQLTCDLTLNGTDSTDAIESAAPAPDGRLAFVEFTSRIDIITPASTAIVLGSLTNPTARATVQPLPYTIPGGPFHSGASQLHWLGSNRLVYLGERLDYHIHCDRCVEWDTLTTGVDVAWIDLDRPGNGPQRVPGTSNATGVSVGSSEDEVYYTLSGDSRVYRHTLSTGAVTVAHDFGAAGSARDVHVVGNRLAAVVGGRVAFGIDPDFGPTQWDSGGTVHLVDLTSGSDAPLDGPGLFRRPQISPSGSAVVAEGYPLIIGEGINPDGTIRQDTTVSRRGDLYLFGQP